MTAALIYLMTHYARTGCPRLALCVSRHMQCLASHPEAPGVLRDICASLHGAWSHAAAPSIPKALCTEMANGAQIRFQPPRAAQRTGAIVAAALHAVVIAARPELRAGALRASRRGADHGQPRQPA